ncbi:MAG TPA: class I SAM-dependent methyltransferase [Candidatus Acidoferrales bacterium]|nr:class I SAM-dependent methyltransferase [Candidatus Acidoferrales bacterium]
MLSSLRSQDLFDLDAETVPPYTESAIVYDHMMKDVDYRRWAKYLMQLAELTGVNTSRSNLNGKSLCELGTGTGNLALHLLKYGFEITGVDISAKMLDVARNKLTRQTRQRLNFINHDMVTHTSENQYDIIICVYDSINYIGERKDLEMFFKNAYFNLRPEGIFIFDASLEPNSTIDPELFTQRGRIKNVFYQRESAYDPKTNTHTTRIRTKRGAKVFEEIHKEYVYDIETLRQAAKNAGFNERFAAGDFTLLRVNGNSERVHFILAK